MSQQDRKPLVNAGGLWVRDDGTISGDLVLGGVKFRASVVKIEDKGGNDRMPDFRITLEGGLWNPKEGSKASLTGSFGKKDNPLRILIFENDGKKRDGTPIQGAPQYRIAVEENDAPLAKDQRQAPAQASIPTDDDVPF